MRKLVDTILARLTDLIVHDRFEELETDTLEIKPVPPSGVEWRKIHQSVNAFLNTRGGILILGVREKSQGPARRYIFEEYRDDIEPKLKEFPRKFTDRAGHQLDLADYFPPMEKRPLLDGCVAVIYVDELPGDRKFCFLEGKAYRRELTGDHKIQEAAIQAQEEYKEEAYHARELQPVPGASLDDLDLDRLNDYIVQLNQTVKVETIKPDLESARPFLERKSFIRAGAVTTLGMLVCGKHPVDHLGFKSQVHGHVEVPHAIAQDKQDLCDNILPLMESSLAFVLRSIQVGVSVSGGGSSLPQYPEELLRETINNALAHRDYSINKHVIISIKPGEHLAILNPGAFRRHLLINTARHPILHRVIPEAKPRNPKLADVLRVYRRWEGRGIGMATLVNLCLENRINLPYYRLHQEEVGLFVCAGKLLDEQMERLFGAFDAYLSRKLNGLEPTESQKSVLAYLIKSEWANEQLRHTILLTPDNNHFQELLALERASLIAKHPDSPELYPLYIVDRTLMKRDYLDELRGIFGSTFDSLDNVAKQVLGVIYQFNHYSTEKTVSAKLASFYLWAQQGRSKEDIKSFDTYYRQIRKIFEKLLKSDFITRQPGGRGYVLNE